ncbi:MAG TPA: hypothetical protein VFI29_04505, partial [Hanamia sp.]|nr:hypothetical protein [Hanamia sp.]
MKPFGLLMIFNMLLFYSNIISARSNYVFELVFNLMGIRYQLTNDRLLFENYPDIKINYSNKRIGDEFFIKSSSLLLENFIKKTNIIVVEKFQTKVLFPNDSSCDLGFDIFSAVFYMVSRYEEYLPFQPDQHGRFKAIDSLAYQNNFLQSPVVDIWIKNLKNILLKKSPSLKTSEPSFRALTTYDIDTAYKYKGRNLLRTTGAVVRDLIQFNFKNTLKRAETLFN